MEILKHVLGVFDDWYHVNIFTVAALIIGVTLLKRINNQLRKFIKK